MKILIVDDDLGIRQLLGEIVNYLGHPYKTAANGKDALFLCEKEEFDLVLLDLFMPGMDGIEVLRELKKTNQEGEVIIITAHGSVSSAVKALELGAYGYIRKPFEQADIYNTLNRVNEVIELRKAYQKFSRERLKPYHIDVLVALSPHQKKIRKKVLTLVKNNNSVLISGEEGVGKSFLTKILHFNSPASESTLLSISPNATAKWLDEGTFIHRDVVILNRNKFRQSLGNH